MIPAASPCTSRLLPACRCVHAVEVRREPLAFCDRGGGVLDERDPEGVELSEQPDVGHRRAGTEPDSVLWRACLKIVEHGRHPGVTNLQAAAQEVALYELL